MVEVEPVASGDLNEVGDAPVLDPFAGEVGIAEAVAGVGDYADAVDVEGGFPLEGRNQVERLVGSGFEFGIDREGEAGLAGPEMAVEIKGRHGHGT